jgi:hypothetical protein
MAVATAAIRAIDDLRTDFDASVNYLRAYITSSGEHEVRNVSGFAGKKSGKTDRGKGKSFNRNKSRESDKGDSKSLDRYYKRDEWWKLDQKTRDKITQMRKKRNISETKSEKSEKKIRWKDKVADDSDDESKDLPTSQRNKKQKSTKK